MNTPAANSQPSLSVNPDEKFKYRVWIVNRRLETETVIEAQSSFSARMIMASRNGLKTYEVIAQRLKLREAVQS